MSRSLQAPIDFSNSEFYGFSEFYYCMEDVLRMGGQYDSDKYSRAATVSKRISSTRDTRDVDVMSLSVCGKFTGFSSVLLGLSRTTAPPNGRH